MKRSTFIKYLIPGAWALQACVKEEAEVPLSVSEPVISVEIEFPKATDFLIAGTLNRIRFNTSPAQQEVELRLLSIQLDKVLAVAKGKHEVYLQIPKTKDQTKYMLLIHKTLFEVTSLLANGEVVSIKQYEKQFAEEKTVPILNTNDIPFALKQEAANTFTALDMTCTHNGCPIGLLANNKFECGCHGSTFDADGKVTKGPALDPLRVFPLQYYPNQQVVVVQNK